MGLILVVLSVFYLLAAVFILLVGTTFQSVIWYGILGFFSSIIMLVLGAPDVALTQFTVGVTLVILVYIMALRKQRRVRLGYIKTPFMITDEYGKFEGIEWELISRITKKEGYHIETIEFSNIDRIIQELREGRLDIICGALTREILENHGWDENIPYLSTIIFDYDGKEIDFVHLKNLSRKNSKVKAKPLKNTKYVFGISDTADDIEDFIKEDLDELASSGELKQIVERYL